ncbi:11369_t:CDS:2, partial [Acaulospora colombiana]
EQLLQQPNVVSSNSVPQQLMLQTQSQRSSLAANDSRQTTSTAPAGNISRDPCSNVLRQRTAGITPNKIVTDRGNTHLLKRRRLLSSSKGPTIVHPRISQRTFNATALYYKVKCKELMDNGVIPNPPIDPPSKIIGIMWYEEPESVRRHYERLAHRIMIEQAHRRSRNPTNTHQLNHIDRNGVNSLSHVHENLTNEGSIIQRPPGLAVSPATCKHNCKSSRNNDDSDTSSISSEDFDHHHVPNISAISCSRGSTSRNFDNIFAEKRQISTNVNDKHGDSPSSPKLSATQTVHDMNREDGHLACDVYDECADDFDENDIAC